MIALADTIRVACLILAILTAAISLRAVVDDSYRNRPQMFRFLGLAALALAVSFAEYHALGRDPFWPALIFNLVGVGLSIAGTAPMVMKRYRRK